MAETVNREDLIKGEEMEKALIEAAEIKKTILTTYKDRDKSNYEQFYQTCLNANPEITEIMNKKGKRRTDADKEALKDFRRKVGRSYKMVCDIITPEDIEEGKPTKIEKLVDRIALVADYLRYIGENALDHEFERRGIKLEFTKLEDRSDVWADEMIRNNIRDIFSSGKKVREDINADTKVMTEEILSRAVPQELVYEKEMNPVGLKKSDWSKLVDLKTKLLMAKEDEQKEKVEDQANSLAAEKQFDQERAKLMQAKLTAMEVQE